MKSASEELKKLRFMSERYIRKTDKLDKVLAQIEATITRAEARKVSDKKQN
tara:strand:+ start:1375 stop:1527 length:153 start_codon:yes stop_codon:yes gene_type:complete